MKSQKLISDVKTREMAAERKSLYSDAQRLQQSVYFMMFCLVFKLCFVECSESNAGPRQEEREKEREYEWGVC